jgi:GNAT superfamily N-acetyltransferase
MIRDAEAADMPRLIEMGRAFNAEAGYAETVPFCERSFAHTLVALAGMGLLLVVDKGDGPVGMAGADLGRAICNHDVLLSREAFWYVEPAYRKGFGRDLLNALETRAKARGAAFFDVVAENGKRDEALARLYRAASYSPAERTFRKRLL